MRIEHLDGSYGPISGATLRLRGLLRPARLLPLKEGKTRTLKRNARVLGVRAFMDPPLVHPDAELDDRLDDVSNSGLLYCMVIKWQEDVMHISALLLRCIEKRSGRFRRVGVLLLFGEDKSSGFLKPHNEGELLPCVAFDKEAGLHMIDLE